MSYYAKIENDVVTQLIVADKNIIESGLFGEPLLWLETDYYSYGGVHYNQDGLPDNKSSFRKNYAGIGFTYDAALDAFIPPKPYPSWILNTQTCLWEAPIPYPNDGNQYVWNEETQSWNNLESI